MKGYIFNALTGIFVFVFSIWMSGPGIAETETPTYRWYFMLLFILWAFGFLLQFKNRTKVTGILITLVPTVFYLVLLLRAITF